MKWNCDSVDETTNNTTESPVFFCSVNDTSAAIHSIVFLSFLNMFWRLWFYHYKHRRSLLFKYFKVSSNWTAIQWPYLVGVILNICIGPTNNASISHRLRRVERNTWNVNKRFHYVLHSLRFVYKLIKSLIIWCLLDRASCDSWRIKNQLAVTSYFYFSS